MSRQRADHRAHHHARPRDQHAAVPERDFIEGYWCVRELEHDDPKRLRLMMLDALAEAFPFHPALPERILLRLNALYDMWRHPMMRNWHGAASHRALSNAVLRIAATQPLGKDGWFHPESFFAELLRRINDEGCA